MINLLPPKQKEELLQERRLKLFLISGFLIIVFLIAVFLLFSAARFYIFGKAQAEKIGLPAQYQNTEKEIQETNAILQSLDDFYARQPSFAAILQKISQALPEGIYLNALTLNPSKEGGSFSLYLQGFSPGREGLLQLKKNLESEAGFRQINFPPSNWVKPENIEFNATLNVKL